MDGANKKKLSISIDLKSSNLLYGKFNVSNCES